MKIRDVVPVSEIQEGGCVDPLHRGGLRQLSALCGPLKVERLSLALSAILLIGSLVLGRVAANNIAAAIAACGAAAGVVAGRAASNTWGRVLAGVVTLGCLAAALLQWRLY